jgi:murein DD-endopeptidase MepM/ murein hydrolase activator NlpD
MARDHWIQLGLLLLAASACSRAAVEPSPARPTARAPSAPELIEQAPVANVTAKLADTLLKSASDVRIEGPHAKSTRLQSGLFNPMPGGVLAGYRGDTGLDIAGVRMPVYAIAAGQLDYSEPGHTVWTGAGDTANTVRLALDEPIIHGKRTITHVWYAHLSKLVYRQAQGAPERIHVAAGSQLGVSGIANGSPHLHLGLLLDGEVAQYWGTYLLEDAVREVLGGWRAGQRLPD